MKISLVTPGRFHFFDLARELQRAGHLSELHTTLPRSVATKFGVDRKHVRSYIGHEILWRTYRQIETLSPIEIPNLQYFFHNRYSATVNMKIGLAADIFVIGSSFMRRLARIIDSSNGKKVLERGSTHILHQTKVLVREYEKVGLKFTGTHPRIIETELEEYQICDYISVPSTFVAETFINYGITQDKILINPYGANLSSFNSSNRYLPRSTDDNGNFIKLLSVGTLSLRKGTAELIEAVNKFGGRYRLTLVGAVEPTFQQILGQLDLTHVAYQKPVRQSDLPGFYNQADFFVLNSKEEGLAMVLMQALASGIPVIASRETGAGDVVIQGKTGLVYGDGDSTLEEVLHKILIDYDFRSQLQVCSVEESKMKDYSWQAYGQRAVEIYKNILNK